MTQQYAWTPAPSNGIIPLRPLGFGEVLSKTFVTLRRNPKVLLLFAVGTQFLAAIIMIVAIFGLTIWTVNRIETAVSSDRQAIAAGSAVLIGVVTIVLSIALQCLTVILQGVVASEVASGVLAEKRTVRELLAGLKRSVWRLIGYTMLISFATVLVIALPIALIAFSTVVLGETAVVFAVLGSMALVLAGTVAFYWISTKLSLVTPAIVIENATIRGGIRRSWQLTRGRFWPILGVIFVIGAIFSAVSYAVSIVVTLVTSMLGTTFMPLGSSSDEASEVSFRLVLSGVSMVVPLVISSISAVVSTSATSLLYIDARIRKEGLDIDLSGYIERRDRGEAELANPYTFDPEKAMAGAYRWTSYGQPTYAAGQAYPGQAYPGQAYGAYPQAYPGQAYGAYPQAYPGPAYPAQPYPGQPYQAQPHGAYPQAYPAAAYPQGYGAQPAAPQQYPAQQYPPQAYVAPSPYGAAPNAPHTATPYPEAAQMSPVYPAAPDTPAYPAAPAPPMYPAAPEVPVSAATPAPADMSVSSELPPAPTADPTSWTAPGASTEN